MAEKKAENGGARQTAQPKTKNASAAEAAPRKAAEKIKKGVEQAAGGAVKAGKGARELTGEAAERAKKSVAETAKRVREEIGPAAERAKKSVAGTAKKVGQEIGPAAETAKKSVAGTAKKVGQEIGPAAERAGKGLRAMFRATARATRKSARILQVRASISAELRNRQKLLAQLGEAYLRVQKKSSPAKGDREVLSSLVSDIEKLDAKIQALEAKEKKARAAP
jgi:hypothetical protein